ncbi:MAG TPA: hypothetical protein VGJ02_10525 [Pyrinomonadaceae bacterium]|jgi:hypothetical protein
MSLNYYNYFTEIEDAFIRRRGRHLLLSPLDWALIEGWQERGVPLHVVLRAIETVFDGFDKQPNQNRTVKSLFYCREEVEAQFAEWSAAQVGAHDGDSGAPQFSREAVMEHINQAAESLRSNPDSDLREDLDRAAARLDELVTNLGDDLEYVDCTLYDIESFLDRALLQNTEKEHLKSLKKAVAGQLKLYKSAMDEGAYKSTFELMLLKCLREDLGIPRLGLFYL